MKEFAIWGIAPNESDEQLLVAEIQGQKITSIFDAIKIQGILERKYQCTNIRIQEIDLTDGFNEAFAKSIKQ